MDDVDVTNALNSEETAWICKLPTSSSAASQGLFTVTLDGRQLRTPAKNYMAIPSEALAWAIASEWDAQKSDKRGIQPASMPLMSLFSTAIDQIAANPTHARETVLSYLPTDSALFYTTEDDRILLRKQKQYLEPVLARMQQDLGLALQTTDQMTLRVEQSPEVVDRVRQVVHGLDPFSLAVLQCMTMECKSLVLSLSFLFKFINLKQLKVASRIEEEFQVEIWGVVEGGHDMDRLNNSVSLSSAATFLGLLEASETHFKTIREIPGK